MREGSLSAPIRHPLDWQNPDFTDRQKVEDELYRVFDICHGCRRCFNLCDSFPRLFDMIDETDSGELDQVPRSRYKEVVDACTLCDMCFMTKCPYVPPHEFNLDFPHLMLRHRAMTLKENGAKFVEKQLTETDRNGKLAAPVAGLVNWATRRHNRPLRKITEAIAGIHHDAELPPFQSKTLVERAAEAAPTINAKAPAKGRKAVIYATCFANYNTPAIGEATRKVLAHNGVETEVIYPGCCGMPQLEQGDIARVADNAAQVAAQLAAWIDRGYDVIPLVASCTLMLKFEWPLIVPDNADVAKLAKATFDATEYVVNMARNEGLAEGLKPLDDGIVAHIACHARAQNMGRKAEELLALIPDTPLTVIERCSGHGGSWGIMKDNFETALKVGKPVVKKALDAAVPHVVSECPLARDHIIQGMERVDNEKAAATHHHHHPLQLLALSYGL